MLNLGEAARIELFYVTFYITVRDGVKNDSYSS